MLAHLLAPALARRGIHHGRVTIAPTFLVSLSPAGAMGVPGVLLQRYGLRRTVAMTRKASPR